MDTRLTTTAEVLLYYLEDGWEADPTVVVDWFEELKGHYSKVYFFLLRHDGKITQMPVLASPILPRLLKDYHLTEIEPMPRFSSLEGDNKEAKATTRLM
ncbi:MAG TPA: hypothetical protein VKQ72_18400 [Aggregatilineales bacterium]|nr:hypothetical protein [Aggregatilineales bacterium]